jgi:hypothetical protein
VQILHLLLKEGENIKHRRNNKCTKTEHGYSFFVKCECGFEINIDIFYYDWFRKCPNCGSGILKRNEEKDWGIEDV